MDILTISDSFSIKRVILFEFLMSESIIPLLIIRTIL